MSELDDPNHPLWNTHKEPPKELFIGFYLGVSGKWITTSVGYNDDPIKFICSHLKRPTRILKYILIEDKEFTEEERLTYHKANSWNHINKVRKIKTPKVRKVRKVKCQTHE